MESIEKFRTESARQEQAELAETFKMFDLNNDGHITKEELGTVMKRLGRNTTENDLQTMINDADTNGNGVVELDEFINMMRAQTKSMTSDETIRQAFKVFDKNGDNFINRDEIRLAMNNLGENVSDKEVDEMLTCMDLNKDGKVSFEEFKKMFE